MNQRGLISATGFENGRSPLDWRLSPASRRKSGYGKLGGKPWGAGLVILVLD